MAASGIINWTLLCFGGHVVMPSVGLKSLSLEFATSSYTILLRTFVNIRTKRSANIIKSKVLVVARSEHNWTDGSHSTSFASGLDDAAECPSIFIYQLLIQRHVLSAHLFSKCAVPFIKLIGPILACKQLFNTLSIAVWPFVVFKCLPRIFAIKYGLTVASAIPFV